MSSQQFPMQEYGKNDKTKNFCKGLMARLTKRIFNTDNRLLVGLPFKLSLDEFFENCINYGSEGEAESEVIAKASWKFIVKK